MKTSSLYFLCIFLVVSSGSIARGQEPLHLADRVREAKLIVVGKLHPYVTVSRNQDSSTIEVEEVLFGAAPTNKTLMVWYQSDRLFTPGIASSTHHVSPTNHYICFLTYDGETQSVSGAVRMLAIGKRRYAHDAFEVATEATLKDVVDLIAERNKNK
jgi:hypothetical protein